MPKIKEQAKKRKCPSCDILKWSFLIKKRSDRRVRCDSCQTEINRVLQAMTPREKSWDDIKQARRILIEDSDKLVLPDVWDRFSSKEKAAIKEYRQALRDITVSCAKPCDVVFPEKPVLGESNV